MLRVAMGFLLVCALVTFINAARADGLFQETLTLRTGQLLVIEESILEPRSVGSYSVRLYSNERPEFPYDRFIMGLVYPRDGVLQVEEAIGCAGPLACDAIGESRWDWPQSVSAPEGTDDDG